MSAGPAIEREIGRVDDEIVSLKAGMAHFQLAICSQQPVAGRSDVVFFKLKPEFDEAKCRKEWAVWQKQLSALEERKAELQRKLNQEATHA